MADAPAVQSDLPLAPTPANGDRDSKEVRVLHFNDCAFVGLNLVTAAAKQGYHWRYLGKSQVRPPVNPGSSLAGRARWLPYFLRRTHELARAQVVHVHYATSVPLIHQRPLPRRPYFLHLHGSDIRRRWQEPQYHDQVQRAIDGAQAVFFTNLDTIEQARQARPDAIYMPAFVRPDLLPPWRYPAEGPSGKVVFTSRWDDDKGVEQQLALARAARQAFPKVTFEGLDWGPGAAAAAKVGVKLRAPMSHAQFLHWLAGADAAIGQANRILAISEFEAMAIGLPLAALGTRIAREDDGTTPPVIEGTPQQVLEGLSQALADPARVAAQLGGQEWVLTHHQADPWVAFLEERYRRTVGV